MPKPKRDYKAEYRRRIARGAAKGISRSQARGHPKAEGDRGLLKASAEANRRRSAATRPQGAAPGKEPERRREGGEDLARTPSPLRHRKEHHRAQGPTMDRPARAAAPDAALFGRAERFRSSSAISTSASKVGRFMSAVSDFLRTNNPAGLREFEGASVTDISGKTHPFETRPNALYRLASAHDQSFEHIYRIVI